MANRIMAQSSKNDREKVAISSSSFLLTATRRTCMARSSESRVEQRRLPCTPMPRPRSGPACLRSASCRRSIAANSLLPLRPRLGRRLASRTRRLLFLWYLNDQHSVRTFLNESLTEANRTSTELACLTFDIFWSSLCFLLPRHSRRTGYRSTPPCRLRHTQRRFI